MMEKTIIDDFTFEDIERNCPEINNVENSSIGKKKCLFGGKDNTNRICDEKYCGYYQTCARRINNYKN